MLLSEVAHWSNNSYITGVLNHHSSGDRFVQQVFLSLNLAHKPYSACIPKTAPHLYGFLFYTHVCNRVCKVLFELI